MGVDLALDGGLAGFPVVTVASDFHLENDTVHDTVLESFSCIPVHRSVQSMPKLSLWKELLSFCGQPLA